MSYLPSSGPVWSFDQSYNSAGSGAAQYVVVATLAAGDVAVVEANIYCAVVTSSLTAEMVQMKVKTIVRRPSGGTLAAQFKPASGDTPSQTLEKQTTASSTGFLMTIQENSTTLGEIRLVINGVAGTTFVGRVFGIVKIN